MELIVNRCDVDIQTHQATTHVCINVINQLGSRVMKKWRGDDPMYGTAFASI